MKFDKQQIDNIEYQTKQYIKRENEKNNFLKDFAGFLDDMDRYIEYQNNIETELFGLLDGNKELTKAYKTTVKRKLLATKIIHSVTKLTSLIEKTGL